MHVSNKPAKAAKRCEEPAVTLAASQAMTGPTPKKDPCTSNDSPLNTHMDTTNHARLDPAKQTLPSSTDSDSTSDNSKKLCVPEKSVYLWL